VAGGKKVHRAGQRGDVDAYRSVRTPVPDGIGRPVEYGNGLAARAETDGGRLRGSWDMGIGGGQATVGVDGDELNAGGGGDDGAALPRSDGDGSDIGAQVERIADRGGPGNSAQGT